MAKTAKKTASQETAIAKQDEATGVVAGYAAVREAQSLIEAQQANDEDIGLSSLVWAKVPSGGGVHWMIDDGLGNVEPHTEITGILAVKCKRSMLWPNLEPSDKDRPLLVSYDLITAHKTGDEWGDISPELLDEARIGETDSFDMSKLYYNQYGSSKSGRGKRMKEQRVLGILREDDLLPLMVSVPATSIKTITTLISRFRKPFYYYIVTLSLSETTNATGQKYSRIEMRVNRETLSDEEASMIKRVYTDPLSNAINNGRDMSEDE